MMLRDSVEPSVRRVRVGRGNSKKDPVVAERVLLKESLPLLSQVRVYRATAFTVYCCFRKKPLASGRDASSTIIDPGNEFKGTLPDALRFHQERSYSSSRGETTPCIVSRAGGEEGAIFLFAASLILAKIVSFSYHRVRSFVMQCTPLTLCLLKFGLQRLN